MQVDVRGQIVPMQEMFRGLAVGLVAGRRRHLPAADGLLPVGPAGAGRAGDGPGGAGRRRRWRCWLTGTTLNIQSFMGAIMAIGVAVANAILLVTFAERSRREDGRRRGGRRRRGARAGCGRS